jgi:hypothetical protein
VRFSTSAAKSSAIVLHHGERLAGVGELDLRVTRVAHLDLLALLAHRHGVGVVEDDELDLAPIRRGDDPSKLVVASRCERKRDALGCGDRLGHLDRHPYRRPGLQQASRADRQLVVEELGDLLEQPRRVVVALIAGLKHAEDRTRSSGPSAPGGRSIALRSGWVIRSVPTPSSMTSVAVDVTSPSSTFQPNNRRRTSSTGIAAG